MALFGIGNTGERAREKALMRPRHASPGWMKNFAKFPPRGLRRKQQVPISTLRDDELMGHGRPSAIELRQLGSRTEYPNPGVGRGNTSTPGDGDAYHNTNFSRALNEWIHWDTVIRPGGRAVQFIIQSMPVVASAPVGYGLKIPVPFALNLPTFNFNAVTDQEVLKQAEQRVTARLSGINRAVGK